MSNTTPARHPPEQVTDEATKEGVRLAKQQGDAYQHMLDYFVTHVATTGGKQHAGDYLVGYAVENAEGLNRWWDGRLHWEEPAQGDNLHVEVAVCDGVDGRFIPELTVYVTLVDPQGAEVGTHQQHFFWHPTIYHYGRNWQVPGDGEYTVRIRIEPPTFPRHDKTNGKRYTEPVEVEFTHVQVKTGRKG